MSIQKDASKEGSSTMVQLTKTISDSISQPTNGSKPPKTIFTSQNQPDKVLPRLCAYRTYSRCNRKTPLVKAVNTVKTVSDVKTIKKVPILKITINKKYNKPGISTISKSKLPDLNNINVCKLEKKDVNESDLKNSNQNPNTLNSASVKSEENITDNNILEKTKNVYIPKTAYTRKGDLSRDNLHSQTAPERIQCLYTKAQRDCDMLKIRLKALKQRHKQEKDEIKKLQICIDDFHKDSMEQYANETSEEQFRDKKINLFVSSESTGEEEYEGVLKKVYKIEGDISNSQCSITASNIKLENVDIQDHETSKIKRKYELPMDCNVLVSKKEEINDHIYNSNVKLFEDLYSGSASITSDFSDNEMFSFKKEYPDQDRINT